MWMSCEGSRGTGWGFGGDAAPLHNLSLPLLSLSDADIMGFGDGRELRNLLHLFPTLSLPLLSLLLLSLASVHGAVIDRPHTWRPLSQQPDQDYQADPAATATDKHGGHASNQQDQHSLQDQHGPFQHGSVSYGSWPNTAPEHLVNWEHPELQESGGAPALAPALAHAALTDGSEETSDVIKAFTQYHLVR